MRGEVENIVDTDRRGFKGPPVFAGVVRPDRAELGDVVARDLLQRGIPHAAGVVTDASPPRPLPPFTPPSRYDVRALAQFRTDDESIQTLVDEIEHARAFVVRVEELRTVIERCWRSETDTDLVALLTLRELVETEKNRAGIIVAAEPAKREQPGLTGRIPLDFP